MLTMIEWNTISSKNNLSYDYECGNCYPCHSQPSGNWICQNLPHYLTRSKWHQHMTRQKLSDLDWKMSFKSNKIHIVVI